MKKYTFRTLSLIRTFSIALLLHLVMCVIPNDTDDKQFSIFLHQNTSDTISPFALIAVCFSRSVENSETVAFSFKPAFYQYHLVPAQTNDTIYIVPSEPFQGSARYVLRPQNQITSSQKEIISPERDSLVFFTFPFEWEPNNSPETADSMPQKIFGIISSVNDTDFFRLYDTTISSFYLASTGSQTTLIIRDISGTTTSEHTFSTYDTFTVPDSFVFPILLQVRSYQRSAGGYYELGIRK